MLNPFARVNSDGTAAQTRGLSSAGTARLGTGNYTVVFNGDLTNCALSATLVHAGATNTLGVVGVSPVVAADKSTTTVSVRTASSVIIGADKPFYVAASC